MSVAGELVLVPPFGQDDATVYRTGPHTLTTDARFVELWGPWDWLEPELELEDAA
jgi:hypothetical protein